MNENHKSIFIAILLKSASNGPIGHHRFGVGVGQVGAGGGWVGVGGRGLQVVGGGESVGRDDALEPHRRPILPEALTI